MRPEKPLRLKEKKRRTGSVFTFTTNPCPPPLLCVYHNSHQRINVHTKRIIYLGYVYSFVKLFGSFTEFIIWCRFRPSANPSGNIWPRHINMDTSGLVNAPLTSVPENTDRWENAVPCSSIHAHWYTPQLPLVKCYVPSHANYLSQVRNTIC